ncbi:unnamed protein product, partial [Urochloa humidicola]
SPSPTSLPNLRRRPIPTGFAVEGGAGPNSRGGRASRGGKRALREWPEGPRARREGEEHHAGGAPDTRPSTAVLLVRPDGNAKKELRLASCRLNCKIMHATR